MVSNQTKLIDFGVEITPLFLNIPRRKIDDVKRK